MLIAELRMGTQATGSTSQSWGFGCVAHREVDRECVVGVEPGGRPLRVHQPGQRPQHQPSQLVGAASGAPVDGGSAAVLSTLDSDAALNAAMGAPRGNDFLSALLGAGRWWRGGPARVCVWGGGTGPSCASQGGYCGARGRGARGRAGGQLRHRLVRQ